MAFRLGQALVALAIGSLSVHLYAAEDVLGRRIPNFVLPDSDGKQIGLADFSQKPLVLVAFLGTECPIGNAYVPTLQKLQQKYAGEDLQVIGINPTPSDTAESVRQHVAEFQITFPVLVDSRQSTVSLFGATRTPEVFLLDRRRVVRYHGRIDDRFGYDYRRDEPRRHDLREAIDELLAGDAVSIAETTPVGCLITRRARQARKGEVTYAGDVAGILRKHCVDCHHPGTAAPFSLLTYDDAANCQR